MKCKKIACAVVLVLLALLVLTACGKSIPEQAVITFDQPESGGEFYFYGVVKSKGVYYAQLLYEYQEAPDQAELVYAPLADEINALFQPEGWVGGWAPEQYMTPAALRRAANSGKISIGAKFYGWAEDGRLKNLEEHNYYQDSDVTGG